MQDRCHRDHCKYFHPPPHIKEQLVTAGKQFGAMMSGFYPVPAYQQTLPVAPGMPSQYGEYGVLPAQFTGDKLSICRDYLTGQCSQSLCHLVHPEHYVRRNHDGTVTMCRDFARSTGCPREQCRFYHPPAHIQELIRPAGLFAPPQGMQQSMFMPTLMGPGFQQSTPLYYSPTASTTTFMYLPGSFPGGSSPVFVPVSYPTNIFPLPSPLPAQSVSSSSGGGETFLQTIVSHQTIQH
ncbi:muscleblind-like protein 3 isoform X2 [Halichondria panicea]|uniref:muscleblind-like protein 3 isoform X2 n=1 Tax=Halichondria panicea TaxID=6063 RepID=UPI00312B85A3